MKKSLSHIGLIFFWSLGWFFTILKLVIYIIGVSTVPEDTKALGIKAQSLVNYISKVPQWVFYGFMFMFVVYLMNNVFSFKEILRKRKNNNAEKLGRKSREIAQNISVIIGRPINRTLYKSEIPRLIATVESTLISFKKLGYVVPTKRNVEDNLHRMKQVQPYFARMGELLSDGHTVDARTFANTYIDLEP